MKRQSDIEWRNQLEKKAEKVNDRLFYLPLVRFLKQQNGKVSLERQLKQKHHNEGSKVFLKINDDQWEIEEHFLWSDETKIYFEVSSRKIKPWPPKRVYSYLFDDLNEKRSYLFFTLNETKIHFYLLTAKALHQLLNSCQLAQEQLFLEDKQCKKNKAPVIKENYQLYYMDKWRSRATLLGIEQTLLMNDCYQIEGETNELYDFITRY